MNDDQRDPSTRSFTFELPEDQASRDRLAELGQLAGGLVHELKNPIGAIDLNVQLLDRQLAGEPVDIDKARRRLGRIAESAHHLQDIVSAFLGFARPGRPDRERVDVNDLLRHLLDEHRAVLTAASIEVTLHGAEDLLAVPADPAQLRMVFLNIILNARDALSTHPGPRRLVLATRNRRERISIVIANNGPPLSDEGAAHLFDPFYSNKEGGTGLGLAIVQRLVELHRGRVWVNSDPGQGVSFTIELPTTLGRARPAAELPQPDAEAVVRDDALEPKEDRAAWPTS